MDIGRRLRELRKAKGLSQRDVEHRTGLLSCYVCRVEKGHTVPTLAVLERWAEALDIGLPQIFAEENEAPEISQRPKGNSVGRQERTLLGFFGQMPLEDRSLLISMAREMVKRAGHRE